MLLFTGCMGPNAAKLITAAGKDPASVSLEVKSIYGTVIYTRTNPGTNSAPHTVKDGAITVR